MYFYESFTVNKTTIKRITHPAPGWKVLCKGECVDVVLPDWQTAMLVARQHDLCWPHYCNTWVPQQPGTYPPYSPPYYEWWNGNVKYTNPCAEVPQLR